jgi:hypothetical protein
MFRSTRSRKAPAVLTSILALPLALTACGGSGSGSDGGDTATLRVLDYYTNDPAKTVWQKALESCASQAGATISRPSQSDVQELGKDIRYIHTGDLVLERHGHHLFGSWMYVLGLVVPCGAFAAFFLWHRRRSRLLADTQGLRGFGPGQEVEAVGAGLW